MEQFCSWSACRIEQLVERLDHHRVGVVVLGREAERHPQEVLDQAAAVVRVQQRLADRLLVGVGRDGRHLGQQPDRRQLDLGLVERVQRVLVEGRQRRHRRRQHRHRVGVAREPVEEPLQVLVQQGVPGDPGREARQLVRGRQLAVDQQVAGLQERRVLRELLDRVAAVAQDADVAVDVGDRRGGGAGVGEPRVQGDDAGLGQQRADLHAGGAFGGGNDLEGQFRLAVAEGGRGRGRIDRGRGVGARLGGRGDRGVGHGGTDASRRCSDSDDGCGLVRSGWSVWGRFTRRTGVVSAGRFLCCPGIYLLPVAPTAAGPVGGVPRRSEGHAPALRRPVARRDGAPSRGERLPSAAGGCRTGPRSEGAQAPDGAHA